MAAPSPPASNPRSADWTSLSVASAHLRASLGDEAFLRVARARAAVWRGGTAGAAAGAVLGPAGYFLARRAGFVFKTAPKNAVGLVALVGAAVGGYLGAGVASAGVREGVAEVMHDAVTPDSLGARSRAAARAHAAADAEAGARVAALLDARAAAAVAWGDADADAAAGARAAECGDVAAAAPAGPRGRAPSGGWGLG